MARTEKTTEYQGDVLDTVLTLRLHIASYGETDALGWWDSYALSDVGEYALGRLFPRTARWAALELGCEAARRHQQHLLDAIPGALHLFDLGSHAEALLQARVLSYKAGELDGQLPLEVAVRPRSVGDLYEALHRLVDEDVLAHARDLVPQSATLVQLASLVGSDLAAVALRRARNLAAAYVHSDRSRLVVPYMPAGPEVGI